MFFGYLNITTTVLKSTPLTFVLITRKSRHRAGTRYNTRGLDVAQNLYILGATADGSLVAGVASDGRIPNYYHLLGLVEIRRMAGLVQTRGSVPVFWAEVNNLSYTPKLQIRGVDTAIEASRRHFDEQIRLYGDNYLVNLVNQKGREERVKAAYEQIVKLLLSSPVESKQASEVTSERFHEIESTKRQQLMDRLHYIYFDFHHECRGLKWHRALLLLDKIGEGLVQQKWFHSVEGGHANTVQSYQQSVVRTNCMDCLDRTNVVQSMLGRWTLNRQMVDIGVLKEGESIENYVNFEEMYRNAWADNADVVSRAYSGTGALKTDFTRTGKRTKAGALADLSNSIVRYLRNNYADGPRQDAYDLFLGNYLPSANNISSSLLFVDRRPVLVQSVPYILGAAVFLELASLVLPAAGRGGISLKLFALFWMLVAAWAAVFLKEYGILYVSWPKLNVPAFVVEGYAETLQKAKKDKVVGQFLAQGPGSGPFAQHERGASLSGGVRSMIHLEEGKKRIE